MKKLILLIGIGCFALAGSGIAQTCSHGSKTVEAKSCVKPSEAALKAASLDASIETKVCEKSGSVCFLKKTTDAQGNVSKSEVKYDEATAQFVSIPENEATAGSEGKVKSCSKSKACCAKGSASGKACCKAKSTAAVAAPDDVAPTTPAKVN